MPFIVVFLLLGMSKLKYCPRFQRELSLQEAEFKKLFEEKEEESRLAREEHELRQARFRNMCTSSFFIATSRVRGFMIMKESCYMAKKVQCCVFILGETEHKSTIFANLKNHVHS